MDTSSSKTGNSGGGDAELSGIGLDDIKCSLVVDVGGVMKWSLSPLNVLAEKMNSGSPVLGLQSRLV